MSFIFFHTLLVIRINLINELKGPPSLHVLALACFVGTPGGERTVLPLSLVHKAQRNIRNPKRLNPSVSPL